MTIDFGLSPCDPRGGAGKSMIKVQGVCARGYGLKGKVEKEGRSLGYQVVGNVFFFSR